MSNVKVTNVDNAAVTVATTETPGIASFNSKDFRVNDEGHVYVKQKVGAIQYLGTVSECIQLTLPTLFAWDINTLVSPKPLEDIRRGDLILNISDYTYKIDDTEYTLEAGTVFVVETTNDGIVTTSEPLFTLKGIVGEQGVGITDVKLISDISTWVMGASIEKS